MALRKKIKEKIFKKKKTQEQIENQAEDALDATLDEVFSNPDQLSQQQERDNIRKKLKKEELSVEEYCNHFVEATCTCDKRKVEYEQVTAYLTDIQMVERIEEPERSNIKKTAERLVILSSDREEIKRDAKKLTDMQFRFMQLHEYEIEDGISLMTEQEKYQSQIHSDMKKLKDESEKLRSEEKYYREKLYNIKMITLSLAFLAIIVCGIILLIYTRYVFPIALYFMLVFVILAIAGTAIFVKYRNVNLALLYCKEQQKRARQLMNKVKIKWVNNTSTLDYLCTKYNVESARELSFLWQQYQEILEKEEKFKRSSRELNRCEEELIKQLKKVGVHDAEIWIYQAEALIDPREMVEVTHNLNERRRKLREDIEFQEEIAELSLNGLKKELKNHPEQSEKVKRLLEENKITVPTT